MSNDLRRWIDLSKPLAEDLGMLPTSVLTGIPDDLMQQMAFFLKIATKMGWDKMARVLQSIMQARRNQDEDDR